MSDGADTSIFAPVIRAKMHSDVAMVEEITPGMKKVCSVAPPPICPIPPSDFLVVLHGWGQTWIWDDLKDICGTNWFAHTIADNSLVAVTNGSYIKEHYPDLCATAFVLECTKGRGQLVGAFAKASVAANAYCGELLGLKRFCPACANVQQYTPIA